jgi:hypothetical protein
MPAHRTPPEQAARVLRAKIAANVRWSKDDPVQGTASARKAFLDRFDHEVDPKGLLPEHERVRRAKHARRAYFARLALKSVEARRHASNRSKRDGGDSDGAA